MSPWEKPAVRFDHSFGFYSQKENAMSLTFYYAPQSSATPVHWALEELGVPYEKVKLNIRGGDTKKPEFTKLNPNAKVPLLVVDGTPIFESCAILLYLGETYGVDKGLFPAPGIKRAEAMKWMVWNGVSIGEAMGRLGRNTTDFYPADQKNAAAGEAAKADIHGLLKILDHALEGKQYLVDNKFSLADLYLASWQQYLAYFKFDTSSYKNLQKWTERCCSRPAGVKTGSETP
jgi:glutathione S-transferase